ncbi:MAG: GNAT family N-acetyltransferase, partial [Anaerolineae bacterium]|nr:GNAT family N-acetyltransferase [Anaerolineae bacterium]
RAMMFTYPVDEEILLELQAPHQAAEQYQLAEDSREFLAPWMNWMRWVHSEANMRQALSYPLRAMANGETWGWTIRYRGATAGRILLSRDSENATGEVGYWLGANFTGYGIMTRAAQAVLDWGFMELGLNRIELHIEADNLASRAVAERLGAVLECTLREETKRESGYGDLCVYGLLAQEWQRHSHPKFDHQLGNGLCLRLQQLHDAEAMFSLLHHNAAHFSRSIARLSPSYTLQDERDFTRTMLQSYADGRAIFMGIWQDQRLIGSLTVLFNSQNFHGRMEYALDENVSAQEVILPAIQAVTRHCFQTLKLNRCWLRFPADDAEQVQIAEEAGFQREALLREWVAIQGQRVDMVVYGLVRGTENKRAQHAAPLS